MKFNLNYLKKNILFFSLLLFVSVSCKRFEEGPLISFRSVDHRIAGEWKVESFTANGVDSMNYLRRFHLDGEWIFAHYVSYSEPPLTVGDKNNGAYGRWSTSERDNHKTIYIHLYEIYKDSVTVSFNTIQDWPFNTDWRIIRLKENDMKLSNMQNSIEYEIHFKPY